MDKTRKLINNTIVNNRNSVGTAGYYGIKLNYSDNTLIANNIIWANGKMSYDSSVGINDGFIQIHEYASTNTTIVANTIQDPNYGDYESGGADADKNMRLLPGFVDFPQADTNGDQRLGMEDCLYILRESL